MPRRSRGSTTRASRTGWRPSRPSRGPPRTSRRGCEEALPLVVVESDGEVVAWAVAHRYRDRAAYAGVGDFSVYVARGERGQGLGRVAVQGLIDECERRGLWKLVSRVFPENEASLALCRSLGFREVGVYRRHAKLDGEWRDVVIVERLL